jgi:hypothetical protein
MLSTKTKNNKTIKTVEYFQKLKFRVRIESFKW